MEKLDTERSRPKAPRWTRFGAVCIASGILATGLYSWENHKDSQSQANKVSAKPAATAPAKPVPESATPTASPKKSETPPTPSRPEDIDVYILGDSLTVRALNNGLRETVAQAGGNLITNAAFARALNRPGRSNQTGLQALEADRDKIEEAEMIVVEQGTNIDDNPEDIREAMRIIRSVNSQAPVSWMNVAAIGHPPHANQERSIKRYNSGNRELVRASKDPNYRFDILNLCGFVFGGTPEKCIINSHPRPGALKDDMVHLSEETGIPQFNKLIANKLRSNRAGQ